MRTLTDHVVSGDSANHQLRIDVVDKPGAGGAHHEYDIVTPSGLGTRISFQNGPIKDAGVNGLTHEALLAVVIDRLRSFQKGPYASEYNERALTLCTDALIQLQQRTRDRLARGVEGTHQK